MYNFTLVLHLSHQTEHFMNQNGYCSNQTEYYLKHCLKEVKYAFLCLEKFYKTPT